MNNFIIYPQIKIVGNFIDKNEINVLDELNKGSCMGMDAIHFILDKVEDEKLKNVLKE